MLGQDKKHLMQIVKAGHELSYLDEEAFELDPSYFHPFFYKRIMEIKADLLMNHRSWFLPEGRVLDEKGLYEKKKFKI